MLTYDKYAALICLPVSRSLVKIRIFQDTLELMVVSCFDCFEVYMHTTKGELKTTLMEGNQICTDCYVVRL